MEARIQKWGNSLGIRIPQQAAKQLQISEGSAVNIEISNENIIIRKKKYDLDEMLKEITPDNLHHLPFEGNPKGQEEW